MTDKTKSPSRMAGYNDTMRQLVARDGLVCFLCGHKHATVHTMQSDMRTIADAGGSFELDNLVIACKPCAKRRNGKPVGAYWRERMSAAAAEQAHIEMMARNKDVLLSLAATLRYAPRITPETPHAVVGTGSTDNVPNRRRPTRIYAYDTVPPEETESAGPNLNRPKDRQHGDIFIDFDKEVLVWDALFERKDGTRGAWLTLEKAVAREMFPADWVSNPAHEAYPPTDYAPRITPETPHAVVGTGSTTLADAIADMGDDEPVADPDIMAAAQIPPDADTVVVHAWFDGELYWRELRHTNPDTGDVIVMEESFPPSYA
jgi:hypothetical protein